MGIPSERLLQNVKNNQDHHLDSFHIQVQTYLKGWT